MNLTVKMLTMSACVGAAFASGMVRADDVKPASTSAVETKAAPAKATRPLSDMRVSRDKETGKLRTPTAEENAALDAKSRSIAPNVVVLSRPVSTVETRADGSAVGKRSLDEMDNLHVTRTADGKTVLHHSDKLAPSAPTK